MFYTSKPVPFGKQVPEIVPGHNPYTLTAMSPLQSEPSEVGAGGGGSKSVQ